MQEITVVDIVIVIIFTYFIISGYNKGFIQQTSTILGLGVALFIAINYYHSFQYYLLPYFNVSGEMLQFISFGLLFLLVYLFILLLGRVFSNLLDMLFLKPVDQLAGAVLGFFKGGVLAYFLVLLLAQIPYTVITESLNNSFLATNLLGFTPYLQQSLENIFGP